MRHRRAIPIVLPPPVPAPRLRGTGARGPRSGHVARLLAVVLTLLAAGTPAALAQADRGPKPPRVASRKPVVVTPIPVPPARAQAPGRAANPVAAGPADRVAAPTPPPTYHGAVSGILQAKCRECHRPGEVGPFALETYEQARKRAGDIATVTEERQMPPWKPAPGVGPRLQHDRSLTPEQIATLRAWADAGAPEGVPAAAATAAPMPQVHPDGWRLGTPDLVLEASEPFTVPATGPDLYRCFVIPTSLASEVAVGAIEFLPGNHKVVHHISTFLDTKGAARQLDAADPGLGYTSFAGPGVEVYGELGFWNTGSRPTHLPEGVGLIIPRGADVVLQIHYHPSGKPETDRTRIGLYFHKAPIRQSLHWNDASNYEFRLPAGEKDVEVRGTWFVPVDVEAYAVAPHMHNLGRSMRITATLPDNTERDLISIPDWDPAWQSMYFFEEPVTLPKGTIVKVIGHFDNSDHARNPNHPPKDVKVGHKVENEMCVGYIAVVKKGQDLTRPGVRDDLYSIFEQQRYKNFRRKVEKRRSAK